VYNRVYHRVYFRRRDTSAKRASQPPYEESENLCEESLPASL